MSSKDEIKQDWVKFLEMKGNLFSDLGMFKWRKHINWRSEFKGHEYTSFETLKGGLNGLNHLFLYLVEMYCYAAAAEGIAKQNESKDDKGITGFWRYRIRNYHIYDFIPRYFLRSHPHTYTERNLMDKINVLERKHHLFFIIFYNTAGHHFVVRFRLALCIFRGSLFPLNASQPPVIVSHEIPRNRLF